MTLEYIINTQGRPHINLGDTGLFPFEVVVVTTNLTTPASVTLQLGQSHQNMIRKKCTGKVLLRYLVIMKNVKRYLCDIEPTHVKLNTIQHSIQRGRPTYIMLRS